MTSQAGMASQAGESDGGMNGHGGDDDGPFGPTEPSHLPRCALGYEFAPSDSLGIAVSLTYDGNQVQLYSFDQSQDTVLVRWTWAPSTWTSWRCFDLLPGVTHLASMNLSNWYPEIFAATHDGYVFVRRGTAGGGWSPWLLFSLPARTTTVRDIAALGGAWPHVLVADGQRVYVRVKEGIEPSAGYGAWRALPETSAELVAGAPTETGVRIFAASEDGAVQSFDLGEQEPAWTAQTAMPFSARDLTAASAAGVARVYALDDTGAAWRLDDETWTPLGSPASPLTGIAAYSRLAGATPLLYGVVAEGRSFVFESGWTELLQ
jgi:hypothetical protein